MSQVQGKCPPKFAGVKQLLEDLITSGEELGASLVVNVAGEEVLDIWSGYKDPERKTLWEENTITNVWSSTKTVVSLAVLVLIDRGQIDPSAQVSRYWPEFAANGKEDVQVRHLLSHTSGISGWDQPFGPEDIYNLKASTDRLAAQAPWWKPGTVSGYQALTMGHLLGELVRRVSGKSLSEFIASELAEPADADFQLGAAEKDWTRISNVIAPPPMPIDFSSLPQDSIVVKTFLGPAIKAEQSWDREWRNAEIGAVNGHGNARSLNRLASVITLGGTTKDKQYLSSDTVDLIFQEQAGGTDLVIGHPVRFGLGYGLRSEGPTAWLPQGKVCFWGGWGGSIVIMDVERQITLTYVMNKMGDGTLGNARTWAYVHKVYEALDYDSVGVPWKPAI